MTNKSGPSIEIYEMPKRGFPPKNYKQKLYYKLVFRKYFFEMTGHLTQ